jgi:uncharacterized repeat protein (TIGR02543 family)
MKGLKKFTVAMLCALLLAAALSGVALACEPDPSPSPDPCPVTYSVVFLPGLHGTFDLSGALAVQLVTAGGAAVAPTVNPCDGWAFVGWDKDFSCVNGPLFVTALYAPLYTVTFDPGEHGSFDPAGAAAVQQVVEGGSATAPTVIPDEGFEFTGWDSDFTNVTHCMTVTALYAPITYTVTFQPNNGNSTWSAEVAYHAKLTRPEDPKYCGHIFGGWYADAALTQLWDFDAGIATADMTLYAQWTPIVITGLPDTYTMYTGGRVTWNPSPADGTWTFDDTYLSRSGGEFTALKAGTTDVTYSVQCVKHTIHVTIKQSELPQTGQPVDAAWLLSGISGVPLLAGFLVRKKKESAK